MVTQTAGRDVLGVFAPEFAALNDDVLFGEVWSREGALDLKTRSIITIAALVGKGLVDSSFAYHLSTAKNNGVTGEEMAEILTHLAFYAGWPNAWAAFRMAVEAYAEKPSASGCDEGRAGADIRTGDFASDSSAGPRSCMFGLGSPNEAYARYFVGNSYLNQLTDPAQTVSVANVTFEPGCRNNWHVHHADVGGGQILLCTDGRGWYQEWGGGARELHPGDAVFIPAGVKHWHGAAKDSWFSHVAFEAPGENCRNEWLEPVEATVYDSLA
ncbi:MAG: carboxymuconolactone decarboxylase family protein [Slackia sp.]|nr:carboxymuconolactone decarboxylase family protein [Slackia sp.]